MIAHSLLQRGPGLPCLAPYVYEFILWGEKEQAAAYVTFEDLPETPQTEVLMAFLTGDEVEAYGIDWDEPLPQEPADSTVSVPETQSVLSDQEMQSAS